MEDYSSSLDEWQDFVSASAEQQQHETAERRLHDDPTDEYLSELNEWCREVDRQCESGSWFGDDGEAEALEHLADAAQVGWE